MAGRLGWVTSASPPAASCAPRRVAVHRRWWHRRGSHTRDTAPWQRHEPQRRPGTLQPVCGGTRRHVRPSVMPCAPPWRELPSQGRGLPADLAPRCWWLSWLAVLHTATAPHPTPAGAGPGVRVRVWRVLRCLGVSTQVAGVGVVVALHPSHCRTPRHLPNHRYTPMALPHPAASHPHPPAAPTQRSTPARAARWLDAWPRARSPHCARPHTQPPLQSPRRWCRHCTAPPADDRQQLARRLLWGGRGRRLMRQQHRRLPPPPDGLEQRHGT